VLGAHFRIDALAAFFLVVVNLGGAAASQFALGLMRSIAFGIYRTHEALEVAWKYFILGGVGIALARFGTILVHMAAQPVIGEGLYAMMWTVLVARAAKFDPALLNVAFVFPLLGYCPKWAWRRCSPGCWTPTLKVRRQSRRCFAACC
jgi:hydrogenase-4 component F